MRLVVRRLGSLVIPEGVTIALAFDQDDVLALNPRSTAPESVQDRSRASTPAEAILAMKRDAKPDCGFRRGPPRRTRSEGLARRGTRPGRRGSSSARPLGSPCQPRMPPGYSRRMAGVARLQCFSRGCLHPLPPARCAAPSAGRGRAFQADSRHNRLGVTATVTPHEYRAVGRDVIFSPWPLIAPTVSRRRTGRQVAITLRFAPGRRESTVSSGVECEWKPAAAMLPASSRRVLARRGDFAFGGRVGRPVLAMFAPPRCGQSGERLGERGHSFGVDAGRRTAADYAAGRLVGRLAGDTESFANPGRLLRARQGPPGRSSKARTLGCRPTRPTRTASSPLGCVRSESRWRPPAALPSLVPRRVTGIVSEEINTCNEYIQFGYLFVPTCVAESSSTRGISRPLSCAPPARHPIRPSGRAATIRGVRGRRCPLFLFGVPVSVP